MVFKLSVTAGYDVGVYSFYPKESEILLGPNTRFVVARALYADADGYSCLDLMQTHGALLSS